MKNLSRNHICFCFLLLTVFLFMVPQPPTYGHTSTTKHTHGPNDDGDTLKTNQQLEEENRQLREWIRNHEEAHKKDFSILLGGGARCISQASRWNTS